MNCSLMKQILSTSKKNAGSHQLKSFQCSEFQHLILRTRLGITTYSTKIKASTMCIFSKFVLAIQCQLDTWQKRIWFSEIFSSIGLGSTFFADRCDIIFFKTWLRNNNANKGRSPSVVPIMRLKLRELAILSVHISAMKQLSAEADSIKSYS
jgi:hypothetical protein